MGDREAVARSLARHIEGLAAWGIDRIHGIPVAPSPPGREAQSSRVETGDAEGLLAAIATEIAACTACTLCETRNHTVPGVGDSHAALLFVGEAPGRDEDLVGEPFVGQAGQLLDKIIGALGLRRDRVYITNILKCRPPRNRDPNPEEVASCTPFLERQISALRPRMIVALGRPAARYLTGIDAPLARLRGRDHDFHGTPLVVTYHPAYLLRNPAAKAKCWQDLQAVVRVFGNGPPE